MSQRARAIKLEALEVRAAARARFDPLAGLQTDAPLTHARKLMDETEADLSIVEDLLTDG